MSGMFFRTALINRDVDMPPRLYYVLLVTEFSELTLYYQLLL